jgi:2-keto-3-deoxy-L-rhamnonate aldolase RhmA
MNQGGGMRGCAVPFVRATGWGTTKTTEEYLRQCREELLVIVQAETPTAVEAIDEIAAVDGIDMIFLGPMDLSCSIGKMGDFQDQGVAELLQTAEQRIRDSPCMLGGFRPPGRDLNEMFGEAGYSLVCGSVDVGLLREAARADVAAASESLEK